MTCNNCIETKDKPFTYKRCVQCGLWCPLDPNDEIKVERRKDRSLVLEARREAKKEKRNARANENANSNSNRGR